MSAALATWPQPAVRSLFFRQRVSEAKRGVPAVPFRIYPPAPAIAHRACQWPMWGATPPPRPALFCAAAVTAGRSYCADHCARAYVPKEAP